MANILRDVIEHGTGRAALKIGRSDLGGKTGTTNDAKDAWFAGFNGKLVTVAWVDLTNRLRLAVVNMVVLLHYRSGLTLWVKHYKVHQQLGSV